MGESKRRKEFQAKNTIIEGGEESLRRPPPEPKYRTLTLDVPVEVWNLAQRLFDVAHDLTTDAPRTKDQWWNLLLGKGCMVIDAHIANLVQQRLREQIAEEKDKPTIERVDSAAANGRLLDQVREILANADSDRDSGPDRSGEGRDGSETGGTLRILSGEVQPSVEGRGSDETPQDPGSNSPESQPER